MSRRNVFENMGTGFPVFFRSQNPGGGGVLPYKGLMRPARVCFTGFLC